MTIPLTKGFVTQVSKQDYKNLSQYKWHYDSGYACRKEKGYKIRMHKVILKTDKIVDHIDGNPLNNTRSNLRIATVAQNAMNMKKAKGKSSIYKGVSKDKNIWRTQIIMDGQRVFSADFPNERYAAMAYDLNAPALFGKYAKLNFS